MDYYEEYEENKGTYELIEADKLPDTLKRLVEKEKVVKKIIFFSKSDFYQDWHPDFSNVSFNTSKDKEEYYILTDKHIIIGTRSKECEIYGDHDIPNEWTEKDLHIHIYRNEDIRAIHLYSDHIIVDIEYGEKGQQIKIPYDKRDVLNDIMLQIW